MGGGMSAYYNEIDEYAAQWLRNLISAGHIAPGDVDTRSITEVHPDDIKNYTQCHFFAGIGVWSHALRRAGWADARPVWTGSCPCQPFSTAGKGAGFDDERHLWPAFGDLIRERRPATVFGEQVASKDADAWIGLVQADLESMGYAVGAVPFPAAGVGAPHIRDRLYWMAYSGSTRGKTWLSAPTRGHEGKPGELNDCRCEHACAEQRPSISGLANTDGDGCKSRIVTAATVGQGNTTVADGSANSASPLNGFWRDADWLLCRDGKWRPVSPKPQSLVDGSAESLGRVCARIIEEIEEEINAWAVESKIDGNQALRDLLCNLRTQAKQCWEAGRIPELHEAPFLLAFLRQLTEQGWRVSERLPVSCEEIAWTHVRGMWGDGKPTGTSCQRGLEGQQSRERTDPMSFLSSLLARHARAAWDNAHAAYAETAHPLAIGARNRVGRLRAYGNAICAEAAVEFIKVAMDYRP